MDPQDLTIRIGTLPGDPEQTLLGNVLVQPVPVEQIHALMAGILTLGYYVQEGSNEFVDIRYEDLQSAHIDPRLLLRTLEQVGVSAEETRLSSGSHGRQAVRCDLEELAAMLSRSGIIPLSEASIEQRLRWQKPPSQYGYNLEPYRPL